MSDTRQHVHELIDRQPSFQLTAVAGLLEAMLDPVTWAVANAPQDDEPVTDEDVRRFREGQAWFAHRAAEAFRWRKSSPNAASSLKTSPYRRKAPSNSAVPDLLAR